MKNYELVKNGLNKKDICMPQRRMELGVRKNNDSVGMQKLQGNF